MSAAGPVPAPLRVLVKGSSLVVMVPERDGAAGDYTFPRLLQNRLHELGRACELDNRGIAGERTKSAFADWDNTLASCPDAVVYGYGYYECIHALLPQPLERHVNSLTWRHGLIRTRYRRWLLRPAWKVGAQTQRVLDKAIGTRLFGRRLRRVLRDYALLIERTRNRVPGRPVVFVLELLGPGGKAGSWFPGMQARIDMMNRALADMVARIDDPDVRLVPVADLTQQLDPPEDPVPDGLHYSPRMRRLLGDWLAVEINRARPPVDSAPVSAPGD